MSQSPKIGTMTKYGPIVERKNGERMPFYVHHLPDPDGGPKLNQFVYVNEDDPWGVEGWCTQNGEWDGPRKLRTMKLVDAGVYPEFVLLETNFEADNTVGTVGPLVCVLNDGRQYVAHNPSKKRRGGNLAEAMRQRHGSLDAKPEVDGEVEMKELGVDEIGLLLTNTACIHAETSDGKIRLALVRGELKIVYASSLPTLPGPFTWVLLEEYMFLTMDDHGQAIIGRAILRGDLKKPISKSVRKVIKKLPAFVAEQCK